MYLPYPYYPQPPLGLSVASLLLIDHTLLPYVMESFHPMRDVILGGEDYDEMRWGIGIVTMVVMMIMMTITIIMIIMMIIVVITTTHVLTSLLLSTAAPRSISSLAASN